MMIVYRMNLFAYFQTSFEVTSQNPEFIFELRPKWCDYIFTCENSFVSFPRSIRESTKIVEQIDGLEFTRSADDALRSRCLNIFMSQDGSIKHQLKSDAFSRWFFTRIPHGTV